MNKHGGRVKKCKVIYIDKTTGRRFTCGMPLDENGQCPQHGRPW